MEDFYQRMRALGLSAEGTDYKGVGSVGLCLSLLMTAGLELRTCVQLGVCSTSCGPT